MRSQRTLSKEQNFRIFSELASVFEALGRKIMENPGHTARKEKENRAYTAVSTIFTHQELQKVWFNTSPDG